MSSETKYGGVHCEKCWLHYEKNAGIHCSNTNCECHSPQQPNEGEKFSAAVCDDGRKSVVITTLTDDTPSNEGSGMEWRKTLIKKWYIYDIERGTPAGAEKDLISFVSIINIFSIVMLSDYK